VSVLGQEIRVVAFVLCGLLFGEVTMRCVDAQLSKDVAHLKSLSRLSQALNESDQLPRVLFLGNSMTRYAVDIPTFEHEFTDRTGLHPSALKMNPDNSSLSDWYYLYRNFFQKPGRKPDVLIMGFQGSHLKDQPPNHAGRMAQYYFRYDDWPAVCHYDMRNFEDRASFLLSSISSLHGNRDRPQARIFDALIPHYREGIQQLVDRIGSTHSAPVATRSSASYERLREFLQLARQEHVHIILAAMPIAENYELDPGLLQLIKTQGVEFIDCRHVPGIEPAMFPDGIHMNPDAAQHYSIFLADAMATDQTFQAQARHLTGQPDQSVPRLR